MDKKKEENILLIFASLSLITLLFVWKNVYHPRWTLEPFSGEAEFLHDVPIALTFDGKMIDWTISNQGENPLYHGDIAAVHYLRNEDWYTVYMPVTSLSPALSLPPGGQFSSRLDLKSYGRLPNGSYRLILPLEKYDWGTWEPYGYTAQSFVIRDGLPQAS